MNTLEKYQADVEAAQKLLERAISSFEEAKKQEEEAEKQLKAAKESLEKAKTNNIGLKIPDVGEKLYIYDLKGNINQYWYKNDYLNGCLSYFGSVNEAQAKAFAEALKVMAELRCQEGIKVPDGKLCWGVRCNCLSGELHIYDYYNLDYQLMSPAFKTEEYAQKAIDNVGEERIIEAYKTMLFMTPESRGEM